MVVQKEQLWRQYIIGGIASLAVTICGFTLGWTAPVNVMLDDPDQSPLPDPVTLDQSAWIGSLMTIGCMIGPFMGGYLSSLIGRKWGLLSTCIPYLVGWILITVATNVAFIYAGRIFWGLASGMVFTLSPIYCAEVSTIEARGALGSNLQTFMASGTLLVYIIGSLSTYYGVAYVGISFVAFYAITFIFMPETPTYYLIKNDRESAAKALATIRGRSIKDVQKELEIISADVQDSRDNKPGTISDVFRGKNFKAFYIGCSLVVFLQFSGIHAVQFYMTEIFVAAGTSIDPGYATIIVGGVQFLAALTAQFVVDRLKRRTLLMISSCGTAVGLGLLGLYFLLAELESPIIESISWLPVFSLVVFMLMFCWGLGGIPYVIIGEIMPIEVKGFFTAFASALGSTCSFLITRFFSVIAEAAGHYVVFWVFALSCLLCCLFTFFVVPESKGKSFNEIQEMLGGSKNKQEVKAVA